jgi:cell wall-associated NlpC family hydrolase
MQYGFQNIKFNYGLISCLVFIFFSCSTTRQLERQQSRDVYEALQLTKDRKDNFTLYREAASWLNVPHREGGTSRKGVDCSFLVGAIYKQVYGIKLERNSEAIFDKNCRKLSKHRLDEGDLVFFNTSRKAGKSINHVGIYLKDNKFIHASTSRGVIVSDLTEAYYLKCWVCGGSVK